jgi:hybrid cluster-associated redox disulfide protein
MEITKEMSITEIVTKHPKAAPVLMAHGMGCLGCAAARFETLAQGAGAHGIDIDRLIKDLNATVTA